MWSSYCPHFYRVVSIVLPSIIVNSSTRGGLDLHTRVHHRSCCRGSSDASLQRSGLHRVHLWLSATATIIVGLWLFGIHPLGFVVSSGGWIMFLITLLIGWCIE